MKQALPILLLVLSLSFSELTYAQERVNLFSTTHHNFGTLAEDGGAVQHTFIGKNDTNSPIVILDVSVGCGCTKAKYSQKPIAPNQSFEVDIIYDPMHQAEGLFYRKLIVHTSAGNIPLTISGDIIPRKKSIAEQYPLLLSNGVRLESNSYTFGYIEHNHSTRSSIGIINTSTKPVDISIIPTTPSSLIEVHYPTTLQPKERGVIDFGYNISPASNTYGLLQDILSIDINGKRAYYQLIINGIVIDSRDNNSDNEEQKMQLSENFIKFGTLKHTQHNVVRTIEINNIGLQELNIRKVECQNGNFSVKLKGSTTIASDKSALLEICFNPSTAAFGVITDRIYIISDDAMRPMRTIKVSAIVEN